MYVNYGDYNFFEMGRLVNYEFNGTEIEILYCEPISDLPGQYLYASCTVDIADTWIKENDMWEQIDLSGLKTKEDKIIFALGALKVYNLDNFRDLYSPQIFLGKRSCKCYHGIKFQLMK